MIKTLYNFKTYQLHTKSNKPNAGSAFNKNHYADKVSFSGLIPDESLKKAKMYVFDLDHTLLEGTPEEQNKIIKLAKKEGATIIYASRRTLDKMLQVAGLDKDLPLPDYFAAIDGQHIYKNVNGKMEEVQDYTEVLGNNFNKEKIRDELLSIKKELSRSEKLSLKEVYKEYEYYSSDLVLELIVKPGYTKKIKENLNDRLKNSGINAEIKIIPYTKKQLDKYFDGQETYIPIEKEKEMRELWKNFGPNKTGGFDSIHISAGSKGQATEYIRTELLKHKNIKPEQVIAVGDDTNDISLANLTKKGAWFIVMSNATEGLRGFVDELGQKAKEHIVESFSPGVKAIIEAITPEKP